MKKSEVATFKETVNLINKRKDENNVLKRDFKNSNSFIKILFSPREEKEEYKINKSKMKIAVAQNKNEIKFLKLYLKERCNIEYKSFIDFIVRILNIYENEEYLSCDFDLEDEDLMMAGSTPIMDSIYEYITLIASEEDIDFAKENYKKGKFRNSGNIHTALSDSKYLLFRREDSKRLVNLKTLGIDVNIPADFSYIDVLIEKLLDLKIQNPTLSDNEAIEVIIESIPTLYKSLKQDMIGTSKKYD